MSPYTQLFKFWELFQVGGFIPDLQALKWMSLDKIVYYMQKCLFQHYLEYLKVEEN